GLTPNVLTRNLQQRVATFPAWAESFVGNRTADPSWRSLAVRLPQMMYAVTDYARFGTSDGAAVANLYLPSGAASHLAVGTLLAANTPAGAAQTASASTAAKDVGIEDKLKMPMSFSFGQISLDVALRDIVEEFNAGLPQGMKPVVLDIQGGDLEAVGITQNKEVRDFNQEGKALRTVLTQLMVSGSHVPVTGPTDPNLELIWCVAPNAENTLFVTTRKSSAAKGYVVPEEFAVPSQ
ncbi:MAG: serine/threonine protein kinase, partial [Planctomycetota bacterium]